MELVWARAILLFLDFLIVGDVCGTVCGQKLLTAKDAKKIRKENLVHPALNPFALS
jgi:hypothetical protein